MGRDGKRKPPSEDPLLRQLGAYACSGCSRILEIERVQTADVDRKDGVATGYVAFEHFCLCRPGELLHSRSLGSYPSFVKLFGSQPTLPYRAPFDYRAVGDDDPMVARWAWELGQLADVGEFLLFAVDAAERRAA